jgi:hypothetical protein
MANHFVPLAIILDLKPVLNESTTSIVLPVEKIPK